MTLTLETVRLAAFLALLAVLYTAETLWPIRPWHAPRSRRLLLHLGLALANTVVLRLTVATPLALLTVYVNRQGLGLAPLLGLSGLPEILATLVALDLADYWWHRVNHRVPFLWRFHQAHHVDTHVDVTTALRFHPGELLLSGLVKATWILIWGPSLWGFAIFELMISAASQYHHSNIDLPDGVESALRLLQVTPRMHASHHSAYSGSLDANFSTIFSLWDRLFGTYIPPTPNHLAVQGLPYGRERDLDPQYLLTLPLQSEPAADDTPRSERPRV